MQKKIIAAAIIKKDEKIFIARRTKKDGCEGLWEFPGGKLEAGETLQECLAREMNEEFGISVTVGDYACSSNFSLRGQPAEMCMFWVHEFTGEIELREHSAGAWVTAAELSNYQFPDPDLPVVAFLQQ